MSHPAEVDDGVQGADEALQAISASAPHRVMRARWR
jgi:hypothetical protein